NLYDVGKIGNAHVYKYSLHSLKCYKKKKLDIPFNDIDVLWLNKYEQFLRKNGNANNTISVYFRTLRSAFNKAIDYKIVKKEYYPFNDFKISRFNEKTEKRALPKDTIHQIMDLEIPKGNKFLQFAKDIFIFSYLCAGINLIDIAYLTEANIKNNTLTYYRHKTGGKITLPLTPEALYIIEKYKDYPAKAGYLFPILHKSRHKTVIQQHNRTRKILSSINKALKKIANMIGLDVNLTTYVARHSYATVLKKSGVNVALISETLGHTDLKTTQIYLDSFDNEQIAGAMENLL
ncbi:MAG: site-specific integrase, partial [Crenarchaeota archaeon]|nr:site-specific integrase [Thermoproteota archaeon]